MMVFHINMLIQSLLQDYDVLIAAGLPACSRSLLQATGMLIQA